MTRSISFLSATNSSTPLQKPADPPDASAVESDFVIVLAALLCTLITVVGLISVVRCAWIRRRGGSDGFGGQTSANKGLSTKVLRSLPKLTYDSYSGGSAVCAICSAEYGDGDEIRLLPQCGHGFHLQCVDTWLRSHSSCPLCRRILVVDRRRKYADGQIACRAETEVKDGQDVAIASSSL